MNYKTLIDQLETISSQALEYPQDAAHFRQIEQILEEIFTAVDPLELEVEIFSLYLLLEHLLTILTGDVRYHEESERLCGEIFLSMAHLLVALANLLKGQENSKIEYDKAYSDTVKSYLHNLQLINQLIAKKK